MIELLDVTLTFDDGGSRLTAVDRADLDCPPGTVTGLTGPSGSGKSSLLAVAATLIRPDSGRILIDGDDVSRLSRAGAARLRRSRIGIVFQQANLLPALTAREQLLVMDRLGDRRRTSASARADELLAEVGLSERAHARPAQLSGGQRQRVNIARALMNAPSVLLVDEPTSALDTERGTAIIDLIVRLTRERGTATLLVTHEEAHLPRLDRVATMRDGRLTVGSEHRPETPAGRRSAAR
ncbi:ABC transporter ATP-binding protein [Rathayibacter sp. VKM Ac-2856]|uniref:ABC transporter ATP-binding protein n=1 Tax=unclassified Rathayibacter TaxID=2609250 RepID=UPI0015651223|nr:MULTISPECIES: ABC transporter ATP-binding protein [unclassified Rathayibacter]NQX04713.1 ABC transporter ATP-binding protein [Rathayibacter sp. VKM Ac-2858]NQX19881.1 ABC transporter ATP-binding protein [Rathayibacter sp. VKM Ac-2856]